MHTETDETCTRTYHRKTQSLPVRFPIRPPLGSLGDLDVDIPVQVKANLGLIQVLRQVRVHCSSQDLQRGDGAEEAKERHEAGGGQEGPRKI